MPRMLDRRVRPNWLFAPIGSLDGPHSPIGRMIRPARGPPKTSPHWACTHAPRAVRWSCRSPRTLPHCQTLERLGAGGPRMCRNHEYTAWTPTETITPDHREHAKQPKHLAEEDSTKAPSTSNT